MEKLYGSVNPRGSIEVMLSYLEVEYHNGQTLPQTK